MWDFISLCGNKLVKLLPIYLFLSFFHKKLPQNNKHFQIFAATNCSHTLLVSALPDIRSLFSIWAAIARVIVDFELVSPPGFTECSVNFTTSIELQFSNNKWFSTETNKKKYICFDKFFKSYSGSSACLWEGLNMAEDWEPVIGKKRNITLISVVSNSNMDRGVQSQKHI